jgi:hypothetical protein
MIPADVVSPASDPHRHARTELGTCLPHFEQIHVYVVAGAPDDISRRIGAWRRCAFPLVRGTSSNPATAARPEVGQK